MADSADIFAAIDKGDNRRLKALITKSPDLAEARDANGVSALLNARYRSNMKAVETLLAAGPKLSLFDAAALGDEARIAELLATNRSLVETYSPDGFTPLHLAVFFGQPAAARILLESDAPVNAVSHNEMMVLPLHSAVASGNHEVVELLVSNGAQVNAVQQGGYTPLHASAQNGDQKSALLLLENGGDRSAKLENGQTPEETARKHGQKELADLIKDWESKRER